MTGCPTDATLRRLQSGTLDDETFALVERHVEWCETCQHVLQLAVRNDRLHTVEAPLPGSAEIPSLSDFVLERELGRGSQSVVYLARETKLDRLVVLKFIPTGRSGDEHGHSPRLPEARAVSRLRLPNTVQLHQAIEGDSWTILVLEYIPGGTLKERLSDPLFPQIAARILQTIARTIGQVHEQGILHLDIKPSNILIDGEPGCPLDAARLKVSDFGVALPLVDHRHIQDGDSGLGGTPSYMAPEQAGALKAPIGPCADIYALGSLLYHALTGRPPNQSSSLSETLRLIGTAQPVPPRQLNPGIPRDLEVICLHCLERLPENRYPTAHALADDLNRFLEGGRISVRSPASIERAARWCRRRPAIATLAITLFLTIIASLATLGYLLRQSESDRLQAIAARERAEENEAMASRTLEEFESWLLPVLSEPKLLQDYHLATAKKDVSELTANLSGESNSTFRMAATVSILQRDLAAKLTSRTNGLTDGLALLARSRAHLSESLRRRPDSDLLRNELVLNLIDSYALAQQQLTYDVADHFLHLTAAHAKSITQREVRQRAFVLLSEEYCWTGLVRRIIGQEEAGRQALSANLAMLEELPADDIDLPDLRLQKARTLSLLGRNDEANPMLRRLALLAPTDWLRFDDAQLAFRICLGMPLIESLVWERPCRDEVGTFDRTQQARDLVESIRRRANQIGVDQPDIPAIAVVLSKFIQISYATDRKRNTVETQTDSVQQFLAFAEEVARTNPQRSECHFLLSDAYEQMAKTARYFDDNATMLAALKNAVTAIRRAAELDPESREIRHLAAAREQKASQAERDLNSKQP